MDDIIKEVNKVNEADAIRKMLYLNWVSNTVVVNKKNDKWRVCVDFTSLKYLLA